MRVGGFEEEGRREGGFIVVSPKAMCVVVYRDKVRYVMLSTVLLLQQQQ